MVLTRAQAAKKQRSPEETSPQSADKPPRKKPLGVSKLNIVQDTSMSHRACKQPAGACEFPTSHPVSAPPSPVGHASDRSFAADTAPTTAPAPAAHALPPGEKPLPKPSERPAVPGDKLPTGPEPVQIEVEYVPRDQLQPVEDAAAAVEACSSGLDSADWVEAVKALNLLRQLVVHHANSCQDKLQQWMLPVVKSVRSLRSSLCKTAIMAVSDLYITYGDALLPLADVGGQAKPLTSLLAQILLKCSSNDKKFVIEEAQLALQTMVEHTTPGKFLDLLLPYLDHKNPKLRGKAGGAATLTVARMQPAEMAGFGMLRLLQMAGKLITDNTPDAREAAKRLVGLLSAAFQDPAVQQQLDVQVPEPEPAEGEAAPAKPSKWEYFCRQNLNASAATAVLKV
ncbi:hypothetical protein N2152v2_009862 [Parachlorella kessleri]